MKNSSASLASALRANPILVRVCALFPKGIPCTAGWSSPTNTFVRISTHLLQRQALITRLIRDRWQDLHLQWKHVRGYLRPDVCFAAVAVHARQPLSHLFTLKSPPPLFCQYFGNSRCPALWKSSASECLCTFGDPCKRGASTVTSSLRSAPLPPPLLWLDFGVTLICPAATVSAGAEPVLCT